MRVFVTGGNGFIGSVVVRKLLEQGYQVRCLLRKKSDFTRIKGLPYERATGDVRDKNTIQDSMFGCDAVVHLAGLSNWKDINSPLMEEVVVKGSRHVIDTACFLGNLRTVFVSSVAAINGTKTAEIQNENSPCTLNLKKFTYSRAKIAAEQQCLKAYSKGLPVVIVNPGEVYGPNDTGLVTAGNLVDFAKSSPVLTCQGGTSVVHVDDVADGIIAAMKQGQPGERYILGGDNLTVRDLAKLTLELLKQKQKRILQVPNWTLQSAGALASSLSLPFPINPAVIPYATRYWMMDNSKAARELGIRFRNARQTLEPTLEWLKSEHHI